jgi:hypothetical protein
MPLNAKGSKILQEMEKEYGKKKGKEVFYASVNSGKIKGVDSADETGEEARLPSVIEPHPVNTVTGSTPFQPPISTQVGDSLAEMNRKNREFWSRRR